VSEILQGLAQRGIVPASLPDQFVLLDQSDVLVVLNGLRVWPGGLEFVLEFRYPPAAVDGPSARELPDSVEADLRVGITLDGEPPRWFAVDPRSGPANGMEYTSGSGTDCSSLYGWYMSLPQAWEALSIHLFRAGSSDRVGSAATLHGEEFRRAQAKIVRAAWSS
jgi:hypothetical protein